MLTKIGIAFLALLSTVVIAGCGNKDTDPQAKVDAPGYYNGPMQPHGGNKKSGPGQSQ